MTLKQTAIVLSCLFVNACVNFSSYQTAETVKPGHTVFVAGLTSTEVTPSATNLDVVYEEAGYVTPELMIRTGISQRIDFGVKTWLSFPVLGWAFDGKFQLIDSPGLDVALDFGVSHYGIEVGFDDDRVEFTDLMPSALFTLNVSDHLNLTVSPKYIKRKISGVNTADENQEYSGVSLTLMIGKGVRFIPEFGYYEGEDNEFSYVGIGLGFGF